MDLADKNGGEEVFTLLHHLRDSCCERDGQICKSTDVSPAEYRVLSTLNFDKTISATEFSKQTKLSPSRSSRVISKLEKSGFVLVDRSLNDARRSEISITLEGAKRRDALKDAHKECFERIEKTLTQDEIGIFVGIVEKLMSAI
jgi:DNA-binding MarR family transcriptional regulator